MNYKMLLRWGILVLLFSIASPSILHAQQSVMVNMAMLDGVELTPNNVFSYDIDNNTGTNQSLNVKGMIRYRNSQLRMSYQYTTTVNPGKNTMSKDKAYNAVWDYSDNALKELFVDYGKMPQGTYEYCVTITINSTHAENQGAAPLDECIYQTVNDIFLINLVSPENNAKLTEYYPMLTWVVNYPFASQLTYRVRVAELKEGQNNQNAINRNNPVFQDNEVLSTGITYPVTAKPLEKFQPYVWTVDAYYKGILLGGAEVWKFIIIEDSLLIEAKVDQSYYEFASHIGDTRLNIAGQMKLKYRADGNGEVFTVKITDAAGNEIKYPDATIQLKNGYNWIVLDMKEKIGLKHKGKYDLHISSNQGKNYDIPFMYLNPLFIK
ncbi:MAG: hypothetical protein JST82_13850 [Bacteroidetes bacterium]|nr:hypothetical protein [Bacteroidota bacterium]